MLNPFSPKSAAQSRSQIPPSKSKSSSAVQMLPSFRLSPHTLQQHQEQTQGSSLSPLTSADIRLSYNSTRSSNSDTDSQSSGEHNNSSSRHHFQRRRISSGGDNKLSSASSGGRKGKAPFGRVAKLGSPGRVHPKVGTMGSTSMMPRDPSELPRYLSSSSTSSRPTTPAGAVSSSTLTDARDAHYAEEHDQYIKAASINSSDNLNDAHMVRLTPIGKVCGVCVGACVIVVPPFISLMFFFFFQIYCIYDT
jgi:hypothetical protein